MVEKTVTALHIPIRPGGALSREIGFLKYFFDGILSLKDGYIYIEIIVSKYPGKGYLSMLFDNILAAGYGIKVVAPLDEKDAEIYKRLWDKPIEFGMVNICKAKGFIKGQEYWHETDELVDIWTKEKTNG